MTDDRPVCDCPCACAIPVPFDGDSCTECLRGDHAGPLPDPDDEDDA